MLNVGVIGLGYIGNIHLDSLNRISGVRVAAASDINTELAEAAAVKHNIPVYYNDYRKIVNDESIDVIHNCTPNKFHCEITKASLEAGKQVMSEKPLAMDLSEAEELLNLAEQKKSVTGVNFCYRYYPLVQEMAARFRSGLAGDLQMVTGTWFQDWLSKVTDYSWRLEKIEGGKSNIAADLGSHWFDLVQFVTNQKIKEVFGDFQTIIKERKKPRGQILAFQESGNAEYESVNVEVEDYASVLFHFDNGRPGSFTASQICNGRKSDTEFQIYGSECSMAWNHNAADKLWIGYRDKPNEVLTESPILQMDASSGYATLPAGHPVGYYSAVMNLFKDFYSMVIDGAEPSEMGRPTFQTGYDEMLILDAIIKSVETGAWTSVV